MINDGEDELTSEEFNFLKSVNVDSSFSSLKSYVNKLRVEDQLVFPTRGLNRRDIALHGLGRVRHIFSASVTKFDFNLQIPGCTDYKNLKSWLLNQEVTRPQMFVRSRFTNEANQEILVSANVDIQQLKIVALNFGGILWERHQSEQEIDQMKKLKKII